jgi:hypothetical protein
MNDVLCGLAKGGGSYCRQRGKEKVKRKKQRLAPPWKRWGCGFLFTFSLLLRPCGDCSRAGSLAEADAGSARGGV